MSTAFFDAQIDFNPLKEEALHLEKLRQRVSSEGWPADPQDAWIFLTTMSASIEKCYSGSERILKNLLQELDGSIPSSNDWHRQLIERARNVGPHGRPPLFGDELAKVFHDLRSFRQRERNSYMQDMDPDIVLNKATAVIKAVHSLGECIDQHSEQEKSRAENDSEVCEICNIAPCVCAGRYVAQGG